MRNSKLKKLISTICKVYAILLKVFPTDDYVSEEFFSATINKNNLLQELKIIVRNMSLRVKLRFGKNSPKYQNLGISFLGKISDEEFIAKVRMIYAFLDEHKSELAEVGMTQLMLDNMADKIKELFDAKIFQIDKSIIRVEKTIERIVKGNEIFKLVSGYCEIGKKVWDGLNPAKYNNYLIYKGSSKPKKKNEEEIILNK